MNRAILLLIAFLAIFAESLLAPFYPMYFERVFQIHNANAVGWYIAACRIVFMAAYPIWAIISKRYSIGNILVCTQGIAGLICIACAYSAGYTFFFVLSLLMVFFKASYLLIYPYLIQNSSSRYKEISVLGIILHIGMISATFISSIWVGQFQIQYLFLIIAAFDFAQMLLSYYFLLPLKATPVSEKIIDENRTEKFSLLRIGVLTLFLYLLSTTLRPFYTEFIMNQKIYVHTILQAGCLFVLPSLSVILFYLIFRKGNASTSNGVLMLVATLFAGTVWLQQYEVLFIAACLIRIAYGFFLFYLCVYLDMAFFKSAGSTQVAVWYGIIHAIQNTAYLAAPLFAGQQIQQHGLHVQFHIAFILSLLFLSITIITSISFKNKQHSYEAIQ